MDELLHHCLRELSFDGDLGCNTSRLQDFVSGFYSHLGHGGVQNADDAFCAFVWSLVVQHPTVVVGLLPEGVTSEVWIAPQTSAKRKAKESGKEHVETAPARLEAIPDSRTTPLDQLKELYGDRLRIAVDSDAIFAAVTGSHIRTSRMSPMVYTALQIITRGRDDGVTVVQLGQKSKYDQKTCFYLVRQLTEMDLVVKVRRGGVGTHFVIHKHFYDRSPAWKAIREEESRAKDAEAVKEPQDEPEEDDELNAIPNLDFTPIDSRHLSSLPLVKARVVRLLKASKNNIHASNNMLLTLGFSNPTKTDRRFFQGRIRELLQQGVIEKVLVPSNRKKSNGTSVKCFRLVTENPANEIEGAVVVQGEDDKEDELIGEAAGVKVNITIHKQIIDLLEDAGTTGMTLNELSTALNNFDKRTIELLLARAEKAQPPRHLADLGIAGLMETSGRERRHRYYTVAAYTQLVAAEQLDKSAAGFGNVDLGHQGEWAETPFTKFYDDVAQLHQFQDTFTRATKTTAKGKRVYKNPILPDGSVKQGRPRKHPEGTTKADKKKKRKLEEMAKAAEEGTEEAEAPDADEEAPKKRARKPSAKAAESASLDTQVVSEAASTAGPAAGGSVSAAPKRRGRPPKRKAEPEQGAEAQPAKKPRGRPRKSAVVEAPAPEAVPEPRIVQAAVESEPTSSPPQPSVPLPAPDPTPEPNVPQPSEQTPEETNSEPREPLVIEASVPTPAETPISRPISPTNSTTGRGRINVSHLRRENEILRVVEESGGIVNIQTKEFYEAHMALLETLSKTGEPTSAPVGTRTDKRTATLTIDSLERKGKVKQLKTAVATHTGLNKPATVVYLPATTQAQLNAFLADLSRASQPNITPSTSTVKIAERLEYGADPTVSSRGVLPLQLLQSDQPSDDKKERWSKNATRANQLFRSSDEHIRDILLTERTTIGQVYGFIVGRAARAREFHLTTLQVIRSESPSPYVLPNSRIIDLNHFCQDVPVGLFTKFVAALTFSAQLETLFETDAGRATPVKELSQELHTILQVGRSRSRSRILDLFDFLRELQVVIPLKISQSSNPFITSQPHGDHPTAFDQWVENDWTPSTPHAAPTYWYFTTEAPVHLWNTRESNPPFWQSASTLDVASAQAFWELLRTACTVSFLPDIIAGGGPTPTATASVSVGRSLRRSISWNDEYVLTWHQMKFLDLAIDVATGATVLDEPDPSVRANALHRLCWVTSAPLATVESHLKSSSRRLQEEKEKILSKNKELKRLKRLAEGKSSIAKKAEEAKAQREKDWTALITRVHPGEFGVVAARIERVRTRFMQASTVRDLQKWEKEVLDAVREAEIAATKILPKATSRRSAVVKAPVPATVTPASGPPIESGLSSAQEGTISHVAASINALIRQQEPLLAQGVYKRKPKGKKKATATAEEEPEPDKKGPRRHRFQWNKDFDELAQDASVIIRARCRNLPRLEWAALEQVFPAVPRNTVRQRLSNLREAPGNESYLRRLEDRWYELWVQHRGTNELPDAHQDSSSDFPLIRHVEFLRTHVDKNALRVGFGQEKNNLATIIPDNVEQLLAEFNVVEDIPTTTTWDFVWNAVVEEGREKRLQRQPFTQELDPLPPQKACSTDNTLVAEAALKVVMGSPPETYDCDVASTLLRSAGEEEVAAATQDLLARGVLSKLQRDPKKQKPGRQLKISDNNQNAIGGMIPRDTYQDASSLLESVHFMSDWREWPLTATDGDALALIHLVAESQVDFKIDTTLAQAAREGLDWNSKRADDDQIETSILARYHVGVNSAAASPETLEQSGGDNAPEDPEAMDTSHSSANHGTAGELPACCRKSSNHGIVDCRACLEDSLRSLQEQLDEAQKSALSRLLSFVRGLGEEGCTKNDLMIGFDEHAFEALHKAYTTEVPLLHWVGYTSLRLIAAEYASRWTVITSQEPLQRTFPRRWLNIQGEKIGDFWQAALRAVCSLVVFRPGMAQSEIRWRLRAVYDRQEVLDALGYLQEEGYLVLRRSSTAPSWLASAPLDDDEEKTAYWFLTNACWYQL
ncbi:hypothetical protein BKA70DRAFT_313865 [Coprinopsis sp. MPI-PUGE-AT-0042]|nr:hypothetical protein BKA70DRAFT_313865 [Coprinopsis sp. MPI-PUGE-AT-0042]